MDHAWSEEESPEIVELLDLDGKERQKMETNEWGLWLSHFVIIIFYFYKYLFSDVYFIF